MPNPEQAYIFYPKPPPPRGGAAGGQKRQNRAATRRGRKNIYKKRIKKGKKLQGKRLKRECYIIRFQNRAAAVLI